MITQAGVTARALVQLQHADNLTICKREGGGGGWMDGRMESFISI